MTNKYEHAVEMLRANLTILPAQEAQLTLLILRAASRLPEGVDPVQVLEEYATWERKKRTGTQGQSNPPAPAPTLIDRLERNAEQAARSAMESPAPASDKNEREHCEQVLFNALGIFGYESKSAWVELLIRERAAAAEAYKRSIQVEPTADEREHCERITREWVEDLEVSTRITAFRETLLRERAAAHQAGFDFGFEAGRKAALPSQHEAFFNDGLKAGGGKCQARIQELEAEVKLRIKAAHDATEAHRATKYYYEADVAAAREQGRAEGYAQGHEEARQLIREEMKNRFGLVL